MGFAAYLNLNCCCERNCMHLPYYAMKLKWIHHFLERPLDPYSNVQKREQNLGLFKNTLQYTMDPLIFANTLENVFVVWKWKPIAPSTKSQKGT